MARPFKRKLFLSVMAASLLAGGVMGAQVLNGNAIAQMGTEAPPMPVPVMEVQQQPVKIWKEFSARLTAVDFVEIRPQVSGLIEKVHFTDGQNVKEGDLLYTIDQRPYAAAVAQAKADLNAAYSDHTYAKKELERAEELIKTGALSRQIYDQRVNALKSASSNIAAAKARLQSAQVDLDNSQIKAPISGHISRTEITEGNLVNAANAPLLTTIVSDQDIYADFELDEQTYLKYIRQQSANGLETEQAVPVKMQLGGDDKWYDGRIKSFDNRLDPTSGTIRARAVFSNEDGALLPGMFTRVQVGSASDENRITIPEKAVNTDQNRKFVYVIDNGDTAAYRAVQLGDNIGGGERIVLSGLESGERIIIDGLMKLRPGAKVQPMSPEQLEQMKAQMAAGAQGGAIPDAVPPADESPAEATESATPEETSSVQEQEPEIVELPPETAGESQNEASVMPEEAPAQEPALTAAPENAIEGSSLLRTDTMKGGLRLNLPTDQTAEQE